MAGNTRVTIPSSLNHPHPESVALEASGLSEWFENGHDDAAEVLDLEGGKDVRWDPEQGWMEGRRGMLTGRRLGDGSMAFGDRLRKVRKQKGLTQDDYSGRSASQATSALSRRRAAGAVQAACPAG